MSLAHSPRIITNNLLFSYDMNNTAKSWLGKPSTNIIVDNPTWWGDGSNQTAFTKEQVTVNDSSLKYRGAQTYLWAPGTSRNGYLQVNGDYSSTTSTVWTFSCYVKRDDGAPITSLSVYMYYPSSDGSAAGTVVDAGNGWYRVSRTRTGSSSYLALAGFAGFSSNHKYYLSGAMITADDHAVGLLDHNTTRAASESLVDQIGGRAITPVGMDYNGDDTFQLNRSTPSYLDLSADWVVKTTGGWTVESWVNFDIVPGGYDNVNAPGNFIGSDSISYNSWYWSVLSNKLALWNKSPGVWKYGSTTIQADTWYQTVLVCDPNGTSYQMYLNGIAEGGDHTSYAWNSSYAGLRVRYMGRGSSGNTRRIDGKLPITRIYDSALTATEVKQNFNAMRGRYGI